ncbi:MAG: hypothetical protein GY898_22000 [Proteobacteria bacterium]|nr:hypothetical protein [Pseudomonadota bacterium]
MPRLLLVAGWFCLVACGPSGPADADGDGVPDATDCAPDNAAIYPEAEDPWGDGFDQDCDGADGIDTDGDGWAANAPETDCDDGDPAVNPGSDDTVGDGVDNNCDGADGVDADGDGFASIDSGGDDCDDDDWFTAPGANDYVGDGGDQNCDGLDGTDADGDGHASVDSLGDDCDDTSPAVYPGAAELCDGVDTDCLPDSTEVDEDGDGWFVCAGDCNDGDASVHPGAIEECNEVDQDCNGVPPSVDSDGDGLAPCAGDCDDGDPSVFPGAPEACNGADDNCDSVVPANESDLDGDGWTGCGGDCDDGSATTHPGAWGESVGDGVDSDCDGQDAAVLLGGASAVFEGTGPMNIFGGAVAPAGDVDNDGLADVLIAAPGSSTTGPGSFTGGRTMLYLGADLAAPSVAPRILSDAHAQIQGEEGLDFSGTSMTGVGDVDGDGRDDLVIGAFGNNEAGQNAGKVYFVPGSALTTGGVLNLDDAAAATHAWTGADEGDELGISVAAAGDVDGDGLADFLMGAHQAGGYEGRAWLVLGATLGSPGTSSVSSVGHRFDGEAAGDFAGTSVAGGGDVDGDGRGDLLIGAPSADGGGFGSGRAYLWFGASIGGPGTYDLDDADRIFEGVVDNEQAGEVVRFADDLDGDARSELLIGNLSGDAGLRVVLSEDLGSGTTVSLSSAALRFPGAITGPNGVSSDVDGDGLADLLVGYPDQGAAGEFAVFLGAALPGSGAVSSSSADYLWAGDVAGDDAGTMAAGAGDVNGDGYDDVLVGTHRPGDSAVVGQAYLLLGPGQ